MTDLQFEIFLFIAGIFVGFILGWGVGMYMGQRIKTEGKERDGR